MFPQPHPTDKRYPLRFVVGFFCLLVLAPQAQAKPEGFCGGLLSRLASVLPATQKRQVREWEATAYTKDLAEWTGLSEAEGRRKMDQALKSGSLDTPEKLFAALDGLQGKPENGFGVQVDRLNAQNVKIHFRNYRLPYGLGSESRGQSGKAAPRSPTTRVKKGWPRLRWHIVPVGRSRHLTVRFANRGPRTPDQLVNLAYEYAVMFSFYRVDRVSEKAPLLSLPFGSERVSYPKQVMKVFHEVEAHLFETLHRLETLYPGAELPLKKRDRLWRFQTAQLGWEMMTRVLFPSYSPMGPYRPTVERYSHYFDGEVHRSDGKYRNRLRLHWAVSRWREVFLTVILLNVLDSASELPETIGQVQDLEEEVKNMKEKYTPEKLNRAMDNYHGEGEGFDLVLEHYNKQIRELEARIAKEGDPDGKLREEIKELEEHRDFLAY